MPLFAIFVMTLLAITLFVWLIVTSQHTNLYSVRNLFMAAWLYYGFSVGVDILLGAEIPYTVGEAYMAEPHAWRAVAFVMSNYMLCGIAFLLAYALTTGRHQPRPIDQQFAIRLPPDWLLAAIHLVAGYAYIKIFFSMDRMARIALSHESAAYKFACLIVPMVLALDVVVILSTQGKKAYLAWGLAILISLVTGNRNYVLFAFLVAAFRWRPSLRGWKLAGMVASCAVLIFAFKSTYSVCQAWWLGDRVSLDMVAESLSFSFSGLDAYASYLIAIFYTGEPSPWWCGTSYVQMPIMMAWPRFLGGYEVVTLAEDYIRTYHPLTAQRGGAMAFSAIAEAWLNFSYLGAVILGVFWGIVASIFDRRPRGVAFFLVLLIISRLFRSDAATLFKNWVLVWGLLFVVVLALLSLYTVLAEPRSRQDKLGTRPSLLKGSL